MSSNSEVQRKTQEVVRTLNRVGLETEITTLRIRPRFFRFMINIGIGPLELISCMGLLSNCILLALNLFDSVPFPSYEHLFRHPHPPGIFFWTALLTVFVGVGGMLTRKCWVRSLCQFLAFVQFLTGTVFFTAVLIYYQVTITFASSLQCQIIYTFAAGWAYIRIQREQGVVETLMEESECGSPGKKPDLSLPGS